MPSVPPGCFSYRSAIEQACFVQCPLMPLGVFVSYAAQRGIEPLDQMALEGLDREGLLPPVGFIVGRPFMAQSDRWLLRDGSLRLREEEPFRPWEEIADEAEHLTGSRRQWQPVYSQWQLLTLVELVAGLKPAMPAVFYQVGLEAYRRDLGVAAAGAGDLETLRDIAAKGRWRDLILVRVQNVAIPMIRGGRYIAGHDGELGNLADWTFEQEERFDWKSAAAECGVDADWLAERYLVVSLHALALDPVVDWMDLAEEVTRGRRERLRGDARVSVDLYDEARVLRRWHFELTGQLLPDIGDVTNPEQATAMREHRYGTAELRSNRAALPALLNDFGLYPWRVELIVEGECDSRMIDRLMILRHGLSLDRIGVHLIDAGGSSPSDDAQRILGGIGSYSNYVRLVFDNEGRAGDLSRRLTAAGVVPERLKARIWDSDIETDNFTFDEICDAVDQRVQVGLGVSDWELDRVAVIDRLALEAGRDTPKGLLSLIQELAADQDPPARFDKPDIAEVLAQMATEKPTLVGDDLRPVVALVNEIRLVAEADRIPASATQPEGA